MFLWFCILRLRGGGYWNEFRLDLGPSDVLQLHPNFGDDRLPSEVIFKIFIDDWHQFYGGYSVAFV